MEVVAFLEDQTYSSTVKNPIQSRRFGNYFWIWNSPRRVGGESFLDLEFFGVGVTFAAPGSDLVLVSLSSGALPSVVCARRVCEEGVIDFAVCACLWYF